MKIWTGKFCLLLAFVLTGCSSTQKDTGPANKDQVPLEMSLQDDRKAIEELRKDIPKEKKEMNDRLAEMLNRWRAQKMEPDRLRDRFDDEIMKLRAQKEKEWSRRREDFQRRQNDSRQEFMSKQKEEREDYLSSKRTSEQRSDFSEKQSTKKERFFDDLHDTKSEFDENLKDDRRDFEQFLANRRSEFRDEYPEYVRNYEQMKKIEDEKKEQEKENPKPYSGWPYKEPGDTSPNPNASSVNGQGSYTDDVNKGGNGWPSSDPREFDQMNKKKGP